MISYKAYFKDLKNKGGKNRLFGIILLFLSLFLSATSVFAGGIPQTELSYPLGSASALGNGDYISSNTGGMNTYYSYFIEVPASTGNVTVDIFDADIGLGANNDYQLGGAWNTDASYTLFDPTGKRRLTTFITGNGTSPTGSNNAWLNFFTSGTGTGNFVRDNFGARSYGNNNGNSNWAASWVESDSAGGGATGGNIQVTNPAAELQVRGPTGDNIYRQADLSGTGLGLSSATFSFSYRTSGNLENWDCVRIDVSGNGGGSYTTLQTFCNDVSGTATYNITAYIASNTRIRFYVSNTVEAGEYFYFDNVMIGDDGGPTTAGHWEFRMDMSSAVTGGDDVNGFAVRALDTSGSPKELNMYAHSFAEPGVLGSGASVTDHFYPFVTSGCTFYSNDFDYDSSGSILFTSRTGAFTQNIATVSGATNWVSNSLTGWTTDFASVDYGIWSAGVTVIGPGGSAGNLVTYYIGNYAVAGTPPTSQPQANTFRMYLPTSAGAAPVKPLLRQTLRHISGPNPPANGSTTRVRIQVELYNPTPYSITFSASNLVTASLPGDARVTYVGSSASATQGTYTQPSGGATAGNIAWNPGTVTASGNPFMTYDVNVTPTGAGQRIPVNGTPASNGTTARYVDETGNTTQARATYTYGPICELAVTEGGSPLPTLVTLSDFRAYEHSGQVVIQWETAFEIDTAGFYLFRLDGSAGEYIRINNRLLPGLLTSPQGGTYSLVDTGASPDNSNTYVLMEIEGKGKENIYGPFTVQVGGDNAIETQNSKQGFNSQMLDGCTNGTCVAKQKTASSIKKSFDSKGTATFTNRDNGKVQKSYGANQYAGYTRKAHGSAEKENRLKAMKEQRTATRDKQAQRAGNMVKISAAENGLYYLDASKIAELVGVSDRYIRRLIQYNFLVMSNQDNEVAYIPAADNTGLYFYGEGIDSIYTKENIYWINRGRGLHMEYIDGDGPVPVAYGTFSETLKIEEDHHIVPILFDNPEADYWFWDYIVSGDPAYGVKTFTIHADGVDDIDTPGSATLTVNLHGFTDTSANPDHHAAVSIIDENNIETVIEPTVPGDDTWDGQAPHSVAYSFSQELLADGTNTIKVTGVLDTGAPHSIFYVDSFALTYQRLYRAHNNKLFCTGDGNPVITAYGFADPDILVFDITDPHKPALIASTTIDGTAGNYRVSFMPSSPDTPYLALSISAAVTDPAAWADSPSNLSRRYNKADYLVIAPEELKGAAQSLVDYRQSQGLKTMAVLLEDIMDEFNSGIYSPEAIRDFLTYAYQNWRGHPKYVVLVGEGTYDYKNNRGFGDNLMPTLFGATPYGLAPSDNLYADVDGDHVPDMAIGRIPVLTSDEFQYILGKIITYEGSIHNQIVLLADNQDDGGDFAANSNKMASLVPPQYEAVKIYLDENDLDYSRQLLFDKMTYGNTLFMNYMGHAGIDRLAQEGLLRTSDLESLINPDNPSVLTAMTCTLGQFAVPGYDSLSEALVIKIDGGAVAVWAPTSLSFNFHSMILDEEFFNAAFQNNKAVLGDVILKAFQGYDAQGGSTYVMDIYNLLGDPALKMR